MPKTMSDLPTVPEIEMPDEKKLRQLNTLCVILLGAVLAMAQLMLLQFSLFPHISINTIPSGRILYDSLRFTLGLAGLFYMVSPSKQDRTMHVIIWGCIQVVGAWSIGYPAASLYRPLGDGLGMFVFLLAPLVTLPSFLGAWVIACCIRDISLRSALVCRRICAAILLGIILLTLGLCAREVYSAHQAHENNNNYCTGQQD